MWKLLVSLIISLVLSVSTAFASTLDEKPSTLSENQCMSYGMTAANISIVESQGASLSDILILLDNPGFKTNPEDIQQLIIVTAMYLTSVGKGQTPEQNVQGATDFCMAAKGDVEKMIKAIQELLGTPI